MIKFIQIINSEGKCIFYEEFEKDFYWTTNLSQFRITSRSIENIEQVARTVRFLQDLSQLTTGENVRFLDLGEEEFYFAFDNNILFMMKCEKGEEDILTFEEKFGIIDTICKTFLDLYPHEKRLELYSCLDDYTIFGEYTQKVIADYYWEALKSKFKKIIHHTPAMHAHVGA